MLPASVSEILLEKLRTSAQSLSFVLNGTKQDFIFFIGTGSKVRTTLRSIINGTIL